MALIRDRLVNGKRVKCEYCNRTHQIRVGSEGTPFIAGEDAFPNSYRRSIPMFESEFVVTGYDYDTWLIAATRYMYQKNRGQTNYTQYLAVCPRCIRNNIEYECTPNTLSGKAQILFNKMDQHINDNPDHVYRLFNTRTATLLTNVSEDNANEEEVDDLDDDNWNDEEEGSNTRFRVGDNVSFVLNEQQMVGVVENAGEDGSFYGVRANGGRYYAVEFITNSMRLFDIDNEELPPVLAQEDAHRQLSVGDSVVILNNEGRESIRPGHDIGKIIGDLADVNYLVVNVLRTNETFSFLRSNLANIRTRRTNIRIGDIVKYTLDDTNNLYIVSRMPSVGTIEAILCDDNVHNVQRFGESNVLLVCYGGFEETPTVEPFDPTTTATPVPPREVTDIWIHHKVKSL